MSKAGKRKKNVTEESAPQSNTKRKRTEKKIEVPVAEPTTSEAGTTQESLSSLVRDASWATNLRDLFNTDNFKQIEQFLNTQWTARKAIFPPKALIFEAFNRTPFDKVKVIILGQDPYHDNGQAHGLAFSVPENISPLPPSLKNIFKELANDMPAFKMPAHGCLDKWANAGVLLLNATLTVEAHTPNSHSRIGWMDFTDGVIQLLSDKRTGLVFILWGNFAHKKEKLINKNKHTIIKTAHPSPLSFNKFLNCKCFAQANAALSNYGEQPIDWSL